jgi:putative metalloprotease
MMTIRLMFLSLLLLAASGCENTDLQLAAEAGIDAFKAVTLTDEAVKGLARASARHADASNTLAPPDNRSAVRLKKVVGETVAMDGMHYQFQVYLDKEVNAFALADGTIRFYSGLLDLLDDGELRFVAGHEMGHVAKNHVRKQMRVAFASSAVRKGIASQGNMAGDLARSALGDFVQELTSAQFSQLEEKEADDHGLAFLRRNNHDPEKAVTALRKLATLGDNHSFLASHPAPGLRAERLELQIQGKSLPIEAQQDDLLARLLAWLDPLLALLPPGLRRLIPLPGQG